MKTEVEVIIDKNGDFYCLFKIKHRFEHTQISRKKAKSLVKNNNLTPRPTSWNPVVWSSKKSIQREIARMKHIYKDPESPVSIKEWAINNIKIFKKCLNKNYFTKERKLRF